MQAFRPANLLKRNSNTGIPCKYCEIFTNIYFEEHPRMGASVFRILSNIYEKDHCVKNVQNTELFLVGIFPHSDWIQRDTSYLSVLSPNAGKYRPEITLYLDTFHAYLSVFCLNAGKYGPEITPYLDTSHSWHLAVNYFCKWFQHRSHCAWGAHIGSFSETYFAVFVLIAAFVHKYPHSVGIFAYNVKYTLIMR